MKTIEINDPRFFYTTAYLDEMQRRFACQEKNVPSWVLAEHTRGFNEHIQKINQGANIICNAYLSIFKLPEQTPSMDGFSCIQPDFLPAIVADDFGSILTKGSSPDDDYFFFGKPLRYNPDFIGSTILGHIGCLKNEDRDNFNIFVPIRPRKVCLDAVDGIIRRFDIHPTIICPQDASGYFIKRD